MSAASDTDVASLLARIRSSRAALEESVNGRSDDQRVTPRRDGWSAKDHLAHVAAWEDYLDGLLHGRGGIETFGLEGPEVLDTDAINAILQARHAALSAGDARRRFARSHAALMVTLEGLTDADLQRPIGSYLPGHDDDERSRRPIVGWIVGNTYEHYDEHRGWIAAAAS